MNAPRQYASAGALRTALETRLLERSRRDGVDLHRLRRQVAFDRLLARMFDAGQVASEGWVLKGGYALELRFHRARSTKDLDLTVRLGSSGPGEHEGDLRERLQQAAEIPLSDYFTFIVGEESLVLGQALAGGSRFPVDARLDGRTFVKFHVDLGLGDEVLEPTERLSGEDWLGFAGIPSVKVPALSAEQHWAEKLHAYKRHLPATLIRMVRQAGVIPRHKSEAVTPSPAPRAESSQSQRSTALNDPGAGRR